MDTFDKSNRLVQDAGCGTFQIIIVSLTYVLLKHPAAYTMLFMSFGNYNPGWRCLDANSTNNLFISSNHSINNLLSANHSTPKSTHFYLNSTSSSFDHLKEQSSESNGDDVYSVQSCAAFAACKQVEFHPEISTVVSEWSLVCDNDWITSLMISIQMVGLVLGSFVFGHVGDLYGRKKTLYTSLALTGVFNICAAFVPSWELFVVFRFCIGFTLSGTLQLYIILPSEFLTSVWRARMIGLPFFHTGGVLFALIAMWSEDWRTIHLIGGIMCLVCCLPAIWVPESVRWLEVNNKRDEFEKVVRKTVDFSKKKLNVNDYLQVEQLQSKRNSSTELDCDDNMGALTQSQTTNTTNLRKFNVLDLFRKGYVLYSIIIAILWMSNSIIYYAIVFGVKTMYGNLYINMIILFGIEIPFSAFSMFVPNILGRKRGTMVFYIISAACLLCASGLELWASTEVKHIGVMVTAVLAKATINVAWYCMVSLTSEIYPTVVRSICLGYANVFSRAGAILAPFLIPRTAETIYICYLVMAVLAVLVSISLVAMPETKDKKLKETF